MRLKLNEKCENPVLDEYLKQRRELLKEKKGENQELLGKITEETVMNARFLTAVKPSKEPIKAKDGGLTLQDGSDISFMMLGSSGGNFLPLFTCAEEMAPWKGTENCLTVALGFDDVVTVIMSDTGCRGTVLNPFTDNLIMQREVADKLRQRKEIRNNGRTTKVLSKDTDIEFLNDNSFPLQLSGKLCEKAKELSAVKSIWLRSVRIDGTDGFLLIADFDGDRDKIFRELESAAKPFLGSKLMYMLSLKDNIPEVWTRNILPVYSVGNG